MLPKITKSIADTYFDSADEKCRRNFRQYSRSVADIIGSNAAKLTILKIRKS